MKRRTLAALALCLALITLSGGAQAALLGVQIPHTPEPTPEETAAPAAQAATLSVSTQPREATPGEADWLGREITMEERDAAGLGERILMRGMEGEDVALMQKRLYQLGYYLDEIDGVFGLRTRTAVYAFQRANKLEKIDGKVGPETIRMMFRADVVIKPTPTPTPTPTPSPTPAPTATPRPTIAPTAVPDAANAPFPMEERDAYVDGKAVRLMLGTEETGGLLYPLCGVMMHLDYMHEHDAGSWTIVNPYTGSEIALMTMGETGLCEDAMGAFDGEIFLAEGEARVYAYAGEAYVTAPVLELLGLQVLDVKGTPVIH